MKQEREGALAFGIRRKLLLSLVDQGFLSLMGIALALALIQKWPPEVFGTFATIMALSYVFDSLQNALVGNLLSVLRPRVKDVGDEAQLLSTLWTANFLLMIFGFIVTVLVGVLVWPETPISFSLSAGAFIGALVLREHMRCLLFSELRTGFVLIIDVIYILFVIVGLCLVWSHRNEFNLTSVSLVLAVANAASCLPAIWACRPSLRFSFSKTVYFRYAEIWRDQSRWTVLGVVTSEFMNRAHVFVVGIFFGAAAVGILQAGAMVCRPISLMLQAWSRLSLPVFARLFASGANASAIRWANVSAAVALIITTTFFVALTIAWPFLEATVFPERYAAVADVIGFWGFATAILMITGIYSVALEGMARFREVSMASVVGCIVTFFALIVVVFLGHYQWAIVAVAAGYLADLITILIILGKLTEGQARKKYHGSIKEKMRRQNLNEAI